MTFESTTLFRLHYTHIEVFYFRVEHDVFLAQHFKHGGQFLWLVNARNTLLDRAHHPQAVLPQPHVLAQLLRVKAPEGHEQILHIRELLKQPLTIKK